MRRVEGGPVALMVILGIVGILGLAEGAEATTIDGYFTTSETLLLPAGTTGSVGLHAAYLPGLHTVETFSLTAKSLNVTETVVQFFDTAGEDARAGTELSRDSRSWILHNTSLTITRNDAENAWAGFYPARMTLNILAADAFDAEPVNEVRLGNTQYDDNGNAGLHTYGVHLEGSYIKSGITGSLQIVGSINAKIHGGQIAQQSDENSTTHETGSFQRMGSTTLTGAGVGFREERWWTITTDEAVVSILSTRNLMHAAYEEARLETTGAIQVAALTGEVKGNGVTYEVNSHVTIIEGALETDLRATTAQGASRLDIIVQGKLENTNMQAIQKASIMASNPPQWTGLMAIGMVAAGMTGGGLYLMKRHVRNQADPVRLIEGLMLDLELAEQAEDWPLVAALAAKGHELASTNGVLWRKEAKALQELGRVEEATKAYRVAASLTEDGEAELMHALLLKQMHASPDEVEELFTQAHAKKQVLWRAYDASDDLSDEEFLAKEFGDA